MNIHICLIFSVIVKFGLRRHYGGLRLKMSLIIRPHSTLYLWLLLHYRIWINLRHCLLKLRQHLPRLVLLTIEFSLKRFIFSMCPLLNVHHWLLQAIKVFFLLVQLLAKIKLAFFQSLFKELELSLSGPCLGILDYLLFFMSGDNFLDYFCQLMYHMFDIICLDRCICMLAYRNFNLV